MEKDLAYSPTGHHNPSAFSRFLWWLATAENELIEDAVVDRNRYRIVGMTVLATWAFATLAWTYFFTTVDAGWLSLPLGIFMGGIILTIDRALIKGISKSAGNRLLPLLFRGVLAVGIGLFMAQPAILFMFKREIALQASLDNEQKKQAKRMQLETIYYSRKDGLLRQRQALERENAAKYAEVAAARNNFLAETDGSGGSGKVGVKEIALVKKLNYEKLDESYRQLRERNLPRIAAIDGELTNIAQDINRQEAAFTGYFNNGFLTQIQALANLLKTSPALQYRYYLLVTILLLIELMPVLSKLLLPSGTYEERVRLREELEKEMANRNSDRERALKELYNSLALQNDTEAIRAFFEITHRDKTKKMQEFSNTWSEGANQTYNSLWKKMKAEILTRPEN